MNIKQNYKLKYLKYKNKYIYLKNKIGGSKKTTDLDLVSFKSKRATSDKFKGIGFKLPKTKRMMSLPTAVNKLNTTELDWSYHSFNKGIYFSKSRMNIINKIIYILKEEFNPCELFSIMNKETIERIGSDSASASVYRMKDNYPIKMELSRGININLDCAIKIMINKNDDDVLKHTNELKYAHIASNLVLNNICEYYPIVLYDSIKCTNIVTYREEDIKKGELYVLSQCVDDTSIHYQRKHILKNKILEKDSIIDIENDPFITKYIDKDEKLNDCYKDKKKTLSGALLVSERASGDLYQIFFGKPNKKMEGDNIWEQRNTTPFWTNLLKKIIIAIYYLPFMHNDLHLGNILLVKKEDGEWIPLIHDFGESTDFNRYIIGATYSNYVLDYMNFFYSIEEAIKTISESKNALNDHNELKPEICKWLKNISIELRNELEIFVKKDNNENISALFIKKMFYIIDSQPTFLI
jgi:hypothetical protein